MNRGSLRDELPRPKNSNRIDYNKLPELMNNCFDRLLSDIKSNGSQEDGGSSDLWYQGLVCYLKSIKDSIDQNTEIPAILISKHVAYKLVRPMIALKEVFDTKEIEAIKRLVEG